MVFEDQEKGGEKQDLKMAKLPRTAAGTISEKGFGQSATQIFFFYGTDGQGTCE